MKKYLTQNKKTGIVEEASVMYKKQPKASRKNEIPDIFYTHLRKSTILEQIKKNEESYKILEDIAEITNLPNNKLAKYIYEMTPKTLASYKQKGRYFSSKVNEISIKVKELYKKGIDVFITKDNFNSWLERNSFGLGNIKPINLLSTSTGIDLVFEELVRIEFGDNA
ncbi:MAG: DUF2384 domain-containing protein [Chlorobi bacterium]|nr:DUF2384 domain-containing protein [Chlorobiota bacterium]